jgi:hypothetical protein
VIEWINSSSARQIAKSCNIVRSTAQEYLKGAEEAKKKQFNIE